MGFPIDLSGYEPVELDLSQEKLTDEQKEQLEKNIEICRDAIVFFTSLGAAKGVGGHTGGAYDIVPEFLLVEGFMKGSDEIYPVHFDESGHRVAIQYLYAVLNGDLDEEKLLHYREWSWENPLPGHPEKGITDGVKFSSGRLGHLWNFVNGVAEAHPDKTLIVYTSDGSQQEGNDAEAARFAVANDLDVKILADDNNVTIAGHPTDYMKGYDLADTWNGHGLEVSVGDPEDLDELYSRIRNAILTDGPVGLVNKRKMAIGIPDVEGEAEAHDAISPEAAIKYLEGKGYEEAIEMLKNPPEVEEEQKEREYLGSSEETEKNRYNFGKIVADIIEEIPEEERQEKVHVVDCDLEGSTGLDGIRERFPDVYTKGGVMERNNYSFASGFGFDDAKQGVFGTFSAFSEMVNSEIKMARLNESNVLAHFSHAGVDWMADNTCHFGDNIFFTDNGLLTQEHTRLYFPADIHQMRAVLEEVFWDEGLRFVFSTRSAVPYILDEQGELYYGDGYEFQPGKDEVIREGSDGYIVSYGAMLYRALDAVERLKQDGIDVGLINKPTLNVVDEEMMHKLKETPFVLVTEAQNYKTGLGVRFGTWLLQRGFKGTYDHIGTTKLGHGGVMAQIPHQELDSDHIQGKVKDLV